MLQYHSQDQKAGGQRAAGQGVWGNRSASDRFTVTVLISCKFEGEAPKRSEQCFFQSESKYHMRSAYIVDTDRGTAGDFT